MSSERPTVDDGVELPRPGPGENWVVGAVIVNERGEVFAQRRSPYRRLFPDTWDIVGGHVDGDETLLDALIREVAEETGWRLTSVRHFLGVETWTGDDGDGVRHEADYVVEVDGDLGSPALERGKHTEHRWLTRGQLTLLTENRARSEQLIYEVVCRALDALGWD